MFIVIVLLVGRGEMESDMKLGSTVWIEHTDDGDIYFKVKMILERQPGSVEICRVCHRGQLDLTGHLIQRGMLDDKVYAVTHCLHCCAITVFVYHVEVGHVVLPEPGNCEDESGKPTQV